jgi:glycosyltransferase involved in cell wall biosynthesis
MSDLQDNNIENQNIIQNNIDNNIDNENIITFIIPTIGRETLIDSVNSIVNQTNKNWKCIIIFDGVKNNYDLCNENITIYEIEKTKGIINQASDVRNYGIQKASSKWIAFLDDDDTIAEDYVEIFYNEQQIFDFDIYVFRMKMDQRIIPNYDCFDFKICDVGISFICHKKIFEKISFQNSHTEDFEFLNNAREKKYKIIISNTIKYYVKEIYNKNNKNDMNDLPIHNKIFINCLNPFLFYHLLQEIA